MKFVSWNVNGLRAVCGKGFDELFASMDADFFCIQETKLSPGALELEFEGYHSYWNLADRKGYSGTAIFTRQQPLSVSYGIGVEEHDREGRVITLDMGDYYLVTRSRSLPGLTTAWPGRRLSAIMSAGLTVRNR